MPVISYPDCAFGSAACFTFEANFDFSLLSRVPNGIADNILYSTPEQVGTADRNTILCPMQSYAAVVIASLEVGVGHNRAQHFGNINRLVGKRFASVNLGKCKQVTDHAVQSFSLLLNARNRRLHRRAIYVANQFGGKIDPRERRAKLVRNVADQSLLCGHELFDLRRHAVEVSHQLCDLIVPTAPLLSCAGGEVSACNFLCRVPQANDGRTQIPGKPKANYSRDCHGDSQAPQ